MSLIRDRIELAKYFNQLEFSVGAEIGVADGRYSEILCDNIKGLTLILVDPWKPYDGNWRGTQYQQKAYETAIERLKKYRPIVLRETSIEASLEVQDNTLDFVFIDGNHHYDYVMEDIIAWTRKVRDGGIVSGHDYYEFATGGVIQAVDDYAKAHKIDIQLTMSNPGGHKDDQCPCWFFVKK